jgi:hypothetical protein
MRKHEIELIVALAEGSLEDETEARALIESSQKARSEYEAQKTALDALASVPSAELADIEKAALHRDIWTALSARPGVAQKTTPWYYRWSYAAAGLFVVVGLIAVLNTGAFSSEDASLERLGSAQESGSESTLASGGTVQADEGTDKGAEAPSLADDAGDGAADVADPVVEFFRENASRVRSGQFNAALAVPENDQETIADQYSACISRAGLDDYETLGEITFAEAESYGLNPETPYLVAVPTAAPLDENTPVAFVELPTCAQIYIDE